MWMVFIKDSGNQPQIFNCVWELNEYQRAIDDIEYTVYEIGDVRVMQRNKPLNKGVPV